MVDQAGDGGGFSLSQAFQSTDGLSKVATMFADYAGRELSPDALAICMFLSQNGSPDLVKLVLSYKRYQVKAKDVIEFTNALSPAMAHKDLIQAQTAAAKELRGS